MNPAIQIVRYPVFPENPSNPARISLRTGVLEINEQAFFMLPEAAQRFVIQHETGHFTLQTFDEQQADEYALQQLALKRPHSLWNAIQAVRMVTRDDENRKRAIEHKALKIAAADGSKEAQRLLGYANADGSSSGTKQNTWMLPVVVIVAIVGLFLTIKNTAK